MQKGLNAFAKNRRMCKAEKPRSWTKNAKKKIPKTLKRNQNKPVPPPTTKQTNTHTPKKPTKQQQRPKPKHTIQRLLYGRTPFGQIMKNTGKT